MTWVDMGGVGLGGGLSGARDTLKILSWIMHDCVHDCMHGTGIFAFIVHLSIYFHFMYRGVIGKREFLQH